MALHVVALWKLLHRVARGVGADLVSPATTSRCWTQSVLKTMNGNERKKRVACVLRCFSSHVIVVVQRNVRTWKSVRWWVTSDWFNSGAKSCAEHCRLAGGAGGAGAVGGTFGNVGSFYKLHRPPWIAERLWDRESSMPCPNPWNGITKTCGRGHDLACVVTLRARKVLMTNLSYCVCPP